MLQKLRTVIYHTNDLAAAKSWYTSFVGKQPYFDEAFYVGFDMNGFELGLDPDMSKTQIGNHSTAYWSVDDINAAVEKAISLGATIIDPVQNVGGTIEVAIIEDPFGNHIGLITGA
jgi:predicted enzyme related to lactoylglutathione lyase